MKAYLHFGGAGTVDTFGPRLTIETMAKDTGAPRSGQTVTGYGARIPSPYMVKHNGKWRRVYIACYGNAGSAYIGKPGAWLATVDVERV